MITKFSSKENLFRNCNSNVIFVTNFDLLYGYADITLRKFIRRWPGIIPLLDKKKFGKNTCRRFHSDKYGTLFILSGKISEIGNEKRIKKEIANFKKWINGINLGTEKPHTCRIDFFSFVWLCSRKIELKFEEIIRSSEKEFEIYR